MSEQHSSQKTIERPWSVNRGVRYEDGVQVRTIPELIQIYADHECLRDRKPAPSFCKHVTKDWTTHQSILDLGLTPIGGVIVMRVKPMRKFRKWTVSGVMFVECSEGWIHRDEVEMAENGLLLSMEEIQSRAEEIRIQRGDQPYPDHPFTWSGEEIGPKTYDLDVDHWADCA